MENNTVIHLSRLYGVLSIFYSLQMNVVQLVILSKKKILTIKIAFA